MILVACFYYVVLFLILLHGLNLRDTFHLWRVQHPVIVVYKPDTVVVAVCDEHFDVVLRLIEEGTDPTRLIQGGVESLLIF